MYRSTLLAFAGLLAGCNQPAKVAEPTPVASAHQMTATAASRLDPEVEAQIDALRAATASFVDLNAAMSAGWNNRITDCWSDPELGGMGFHYAKTALIDGTVEALKPEALLYAPIGNSGALRFVAVEYIVPFAAWTGAQPPSLYGEIFRRNEDLKLWVLHVWHERKNPRGIFEHWNPTVSCKHANP